MTCHMTCDKFRRILSHNNMPCEAIVKGLTIPTAHSANRSDIDF